MEMIKIHDFETCTILPLKDGLEWKEFRIRKKKQGWFLAFEKKEYRLTREGVRIQKWTLSLYQKPQQWCLKTLGSICVLGRDSTCDICIKDSTISKQHFQIQEDHFQDLESTNGTYRNGKRFFSGQLQPGDHLFFGYQEAYFIPGYLILESESSKTSDSPMYSTPEAWKEFPPCQPTISIPACIDFTLESPQSIAKAQKGKLLQAIGSSLLILTSGVMSTLIVWISMPSQGQSVFSLMLNSISMSLAFGAYGLWNRESTYKEKVKEYKKQEEQYVAYCDECRYTLQQYQEQYEGQMQRLEAQYQLSLSNYQREAYQEYRLLLGWVPGKWLHLHYSLPNYLQKKEPLFQHQQLFIESVDTHTQLPFFLHQEEIFYLPCMSKEWIHQLFLQWLLVAYQKQRKWVWVDSQMSLEHEFLNHPACQQKRQKLLVTNPKEWSDLLGHLDCQMEYTFFIKEKFAQPFPTSKHTFICLDPSAKAFQPIHFTENTILFRQLLSKGFEEPPSIIKEIYKKELSRLLLSDIRGEKVNMDISLGKTKLGQQIQISLDENKEGPHGFLAGMTGSGKSELLKGMLLQLVLQNSPEKLQYLLIDFKGGAFGQNFIQYAHCRGTLTNLDQEEMERFEISLQSFLEERQRKLRQFIQDYPQQTAHVDAYNQVYPHQPLAHVLIIVDELAELKENFPDFMIKLKEIARIGRSLGIHCLLSTQKPLGVIDDQIRANLNFKICLPMASASDSYEVLRSDKAFILQQPGQFICQVQGMEQIGQAWYFQQETYRYDVGFCEVDEAQNELYSYHQQTQTVFEQLSSRIETYHDKKDWIIQPFHQGCFQKEELALIDDPYHRHVQNWYPQKAQKVAVLCALPQRQKEFIRSIVAWAKIPVYGLGIEDEYLDETLNEKRFFSIDTFEKDCIWIIDASFVKPATLKQLDDVHVIVFILMKSWDRSYASWITLCQERICIDFETIDDVRSFFTCRVPPQLSCSNHQGWICQDHQLHSILFKNPQTKLSKQKKAKAYRLQPDCQGFLLGTNLDHHKEVFWEGKRPLLICYAQESAYSHIVELLEKWQTQAALNIQTDLSVVADVYVLHVLYAMHQIQSESFLSKIYDLDIFWVGKGVKDYAYMLKRSCPQDGETTNVAWIQDEVFRIS